MAIHPSDTDPVPDAIDGSGSTDTGVARCIPRFDPANSGHVRLRRLERLTWLLDRAIPVGRFRIGLDPIIGLLPGVGDAIGAVLSLYVLYEGARLGAPGHILVRMALNILIEAIIGVIPVLGDAFDFIWQANSRNMRLIRQHHRPDWRPRPLRAVWISVLVAAILVLSVVIGAAWLMIWALAKLLDL